MQIEWVLPCNLGAPSKKTRFCRKQRSSAYELRQEGAEPLHLGGAWHSKVVNPFYKKNSKSDRWLEEIITPVAFVAKQSILSKQLIYDRGAVPDNKPGWTMDLLRSRKRSLFRMATPFTIIKHACDGIKWHAVASTRLLCQTRSTTTITWKLLSYSFPIPCQQHCHGPRKLWTDVQDTACWKHHQRGLQLNFKTGTEQQALTWSARHEVFS